jgi:hypothetical protein
MAGKIHAADCAATPLRSRSAVAVETFSRSRAHNPAGAAMQRFDVISHAVVRALAACWKQFLAGLHESRRRQAAIEQARYRHLIYDAETGTSFAMNGAEQKVTSDGTVLPLASKGKRDRANCK